MTRRIFSVIMVISWIGMCSPLLAGDLVSPKLLGPLSHSPTPYLRGSIAAFGLPQSGQTQPQSQPQPESKTQARRMTTTGKVLTIAGLALLGSGLYFVARPDTFVNSTCSGYANCQDMRTIMKVAGAADAGTGAVLLIVGLTRRE